MRRYAEKHNYKAKYLEGEAIDFTATFHCK